MHHLLSRARASAATITVLAVAGVGLSVAAGLAPIVAGPARDGTAVTPVGYRVTPAGLQTTLGDLPLAVQLSPDQSLLLVSNDGQGTQSLQVVDPATSQVVQTIEYQSPESLFYGLAFSPDGATAYAAGGGDEKIHVYQVAGGRLAETAPIPVAAAAGGSGSTNMFHAGVVATPDGKRLVVADHLADAASVVDLATGAAGTVPVGHAPLSVAVTSDSKTAYVTNQGESSVSVLDISGAVPRVRDTIAVGTHPNGEALDATGHRLYVADADSDQVSVVDTTTDKVTGTIDLAPYAGAPVGTNPTGLALAPDRTTLYVADSGNNDVDVVDLAKGRVTGAVPTAWYPTAVAVTNDKLFVANAKGLGAGPNTGPGYPNPMSPTQSPTQYVGSMIKGTLSTVAAPINPGKLHQGLDQVADNDGFGRTHKGTPQQPIKHVIYVVQENRTFDQVFGSLGRGNGDPSLNLFGDESATNQRALEQRFVTLDNFYADAEVSAQGWNWATAAASNPYSEALWPANYSGRHAPYPSESNDPAITPNRTPSQSYIWDELAAREVSFRNYGFYVNGSAMDEIGTDPVLDANTDHHYRGFDMNCPDNPDTFIPRSAACGTPRFTEWKSEFDSYVAHNDLPTVELLRLPNDHTSGTKPGMPTPQAYVADNDLALGRVVDAVSHSPYWKDTAIFVTEDDAQNGPDHVDAHRTVAEVISPYSQAGRLDSTFYSTASMLRTVEDLVGVSPLTQFDAYSTPMTASFTGKANTTPYAAVRPADAGEHANTTASPLAAESAAQPLQQEDQIDMAIFNRAVWASVKGPDTPMPPPVHRFAG